MKKSALVKELMHGVLGLVANAKYRTERSRAGAKVRNFTKEFQAVALGLQGEILRGTVAVDYNFLYLNLCGLATAHRGHEQSANLDGCSRGYAPQEVLRHALKINHALQIGARGSVVERNKALGTKGPNPSASRYGLLLGGGLKDLRYGHTSWHNLWLRRTQITRNFGTIALFRAVIY
jgi:hypothetical protein